MTAKTTEKDTASEKKDEANVGEDKNSDEVTVPKKFEALVKQIEEMSLLDASELVSILEKKFGVSAAAPMMMAGAAAPSADEAEDSAPSTVTVELTDVGSNKIGVIKALRAITELGLKEAKDLADGAPAIVKENVAREEADEMKKQLEEAGGTVAFK